MGCIERWKKHKDSRNAKKKIKCEIKKRRKQDLLYDFDQDYEGKTPDIFLFFESQRRDLFYSALIKDIVKDNRTSQKLKISFFIIVCLAFIGVCGVGAYVLISVVNKNEISLSDVGTAFAGFGSIIGAIIVLPQIIANHLFPGNSEEIRFGFLRRNHELDQDESDQNEIEELFNEDESSDDSQKK